MNPVLRTILYGSPLSFVLLGMVGSTAAASAQDAAQTELKQRVEQLRESGSLRIDGRTVRSSLPVAPIYERRAFAPVWTVPPRAEDLLRAIRAAAADGLEPADYHLAVLEAPSSAARTPTALANLDLLRTDALLRLVHDTRFGKVDPGRYAAVERDPARISSDLVQLVSGIVDSGRIAEGVAALRPDHIVYRGLMDALADLRRIEREGGWDPIQPGPTMRVASLDPRVPALRSRLARSEDLAAEYLSRDSVFDVPLETALKRFQHRHALNEDGVLGPATLAELNVPVGRRIQQVRVNLERARWVTHDLPARFVVVNIAGAMVYLVHGSDVVFESRAIVGRTYTRTPIFRATMRYVDLNPTWTVPPGIVREVLADVRRDPNYLRRMDMRVVDHSGRPVDVSASRLAGYTAATFPYTFRQEPGPLNPLGHVKLVFPNPFHVYLHDTPSKQLFAREERMFSHGCIRVQNPLRLAELVIDDPTRWNREAIEAVVRTGRTRTIMLAQPLPVLVLYWTASADLHGELHFYRDVYGRDAAVLEALGGR